MAPKKKSKEKTKNKGPKGKKARVKAKLERQWGEEVTQETKLRKGKSRISDQQQRGKNGKGKLERKPKKQSPAAVSETVSDSYSSDDDLSDNGGDSDNDGAGAFTSLLSSIARNNGDVRMDDDDDDSIDQSVNNSEPEEMDEDDDDAAADVDPILRDSFTERFSQPPLPEDEEQRTKTMAGLQKTTKVTVSHVDSSMEVHVSNKLQETLHLPVSSSTSKSTEEPTPAATAKAASDWNKLALSSYASGRELLQKQWEKNNIKKKVFTPLQSVLYPVLSNYADVLLTTEARTNQKRQPSQNAILLHVLNHVLTSRGRIQKHNKRIKAVEAAEDKKEKEEEDNDKTISEHDPEVWRDQGYTRPTVLILLPTRGMCYSLVQALISLLGDDVNVENEDRFKEEFGPPLVDEEETTDQLENRRRQVLKQKGAEWLELFGDDVNDDDDFKMGLALIPKGNKKSKMDKNAAGETNCSVKLYNDFYRSDIILASPLGLKMATSDSEEKAGDVDFLSSIEVCWVARADALLMQNWDHVNDVMNIVNQQPKNTNDTDFSRVRPYHLAGQSAYWRQMIVTSTLTDPLILSMFKRFAKSAQGLAKIRRRTPEEDATIANVILATRQVFQRVTATSFSTQSEDRLAYFTAKVLPQILRNQQKHTLIFIPSYFDFVALRSVLLKLPEPIDFVSVTEYARTSEVSRGRARFLQGRKPLMLYTGRAHYFHRHFMKGVRHLVFLGLPEDPTFYSDHVNLLNDFGNNHDNGKQNDSIATAASGGNVASCLAVFTKYDAHALERVVGSSNSRRMLQGEKSTFLFTS
jgi:U3 small nucleolar RNA-associated protein 25